MGFDGALVFWVILGVALLVLEMLTGTLILLGFGISALIIFLFKLMFLNSIATEFILFAVFGIIGIFIFRKKIKSFSSKSTFETDLNQTFTLDQSLPAGGSKSVSYQGTIWTAENLEDFDLIIGDKVQIIKTEGIKLFVKKSREHKHG